MNDACEGVASRPIFWLVEANLTSHDYELLKHELYDQSWLDACETIQRLSPGTGALKRFIEVTINKRLFASTDYEVVIDLTL